MVRIASGICGQPIGESCLEGSVERSLLRSLELENSRGNQRLIQAAANDAIRVTEEFENVLFWGEERPLLREEEKIPPEIRQNPTSLSSILRIFLDQERPLTDRYSAQRHLALTMGAAINRRTERGHEKVIEKLFPQDGDRERLAIRFNGQRFIGWKREGEKDWQTALNETLEETDKIKMLGVARLVVPVREVKAEVFLVKRKKTVFSCLTKAVRKEDGRIEDRTCLYLITRFGEDTFLTPWLQSLEEQGYELVMGLPKLRENHNPHSNKGFIIPKTKIHLRPINGPRTTMEIQIYSPRSFFQIFLSGKEEYSHATYKLRTFIQAGKILYPEEIYPKIKWGEFGQKWLAEEVQKRIND